jgi:signal transduction histidine kinase
VVAVPTLLHLLQVRSGPPVPDQSDAVAAAAAVLALAQGLPLLWHRSRPLAAAAVCLPATAVSLLLVPVPPYAAFVVVYAVAAWGAGSWRSTGAVGAGLLGILAVAGVRWGESANWLSTAVLATVVALLAGALSRVRRAELEALRGRAAALERERDAAAARAVAEERLRVARDLHDLVGHGLSAIAVQASTARLALQRGEVGRATEAMAAVESATRESLVDMRQVLGVLRSDADAPSSPAPGLQDLEGLVSHAAAAGCTVSTEVVGDVAAVPPSVSLSAYRIVQEALTNVVKHAPHAAVQVRVVAGSEAVDLLVEDQPTGVAAAPRSSSAGQSQSAHGVLGMRERAAAHGGRLDAGPSGRGGWRVAAHLPLPREDRA